MEYPLINLDESCKYWCLLFFHLLSFLFQFKLTLEVCPIYLVGFDLYGCPNTTYGIVSFKVNMIYKPFDFYMT